MFCASFDTTGDMGAMSAMWDSGDFAFSADTALYYTYMPAGPFPPGSVPSVDGGQWAPINSGGPPPPATTAYVEDLYICTLPTSVLDVVYISAPGTVDRADASTLGVGAAIGIVSSKPTPTSAYVRYMGKLSGFGALIPGSVYYLGAAPGTLVLTPVDAPGNVVQKIGVADTATTLVLSVSPNTTVL
jgi:hypothetical protein